MLVLPVIAIFLWIFVAGLVHDWRADGSDDGPARWLSMATFLPWVKPRGAAALGDDDPYPAESPAPPAADPVPAGAAPAEEPATAPTTAPRLTPVPALVASAVAAPMLAASVVTASAVAAGHDPVDVSAVAS